MKILIIEDELLAQAKLETMLKVLDGSIEILAKLGSVKDTIQWLTENPTPDVAFVDIQLSDDHSFEIFKKVPVHFPVIFTTAYDKYLLESFEFNSIDYLLKPITEEKLKRSLQKIKTLKQHFTQESVDNLIQNTRKNIVQDKLIVKKGTEFIALDLQEIAYFFTEHRIVFARDLHGRRFIADKNMGELEHSLNAHQFFRINRKFIASKNAIEKFKPDHGKIRIFLKPGVEEAIYVSKETAPFFRKWIGAT